MYTKIFIVTMLHHCSMWKVFPGCHTLSKSCTSLLCVLMYSYHLLEKSRKKKVHSIKLCGAVVLEILWTQTIPCREELAKNINADEAAAMGAVYQAAALSKAFKVKPFLVRDAAVFPIQVNTEWCLIDFNNIHVAFLLFVCFFNVYGICYLRPT